VRGLFRGVSGAVARVMCGSSAQLTTFSLVKEKLVKDAWFLPSSWAVPVVSSLVSSVAVVLCMTPFDVVSTRLYNQPVNAEGKGESMLAEPRTEVIRGPTPLSFTGLLYRGFWDACMQIGVKEGFMGFYKGMAASYFRIGPHSILSLTFWDVFRETYRSVTVKTK
jgi:solute carrier family 25, member 34/35